MAKKPRRRINALTAILAVLAVLVLVVVAALQLTGGGARQGATADLTAADVQRITPQDARELIQEGNAILFDVRSEAEYNQAHAEGAFHYPVAEAEQLVDTLPDEGALIFY